MPDLRSKFLEGTPSNGTVGTSIPAGLPNITGRFGPTIRHPVTSGAFYADGTEHTVSEEGWDSSMIGFNASRSSSIYGNSTTVQPPAVCVNYIIKY